MSMKIEVRQIPNPVRLTELTKPFAIYSVKKLAKWLRAHGTEPYSIQLPRRGGLSRGAGQHLVINKNVATAMFMLRIEELRRQFAETIGLDSDKDIVSCGIWEVTENGTH
jgi:hypothetical protein